MRTIIFKYNKGWNDTVEEEFKFDDDVPDEVIDREFADWAWEQVMDNFTWYDKEG